MIRINLLSPSDKENLKWEKMNNMAMKSIVWVLLAEAVFVGVFLFSVQYVQMEKDASAARLSEVNNRAETQEVGKIEEDMRSVKAKAASVYAIQQGGMGWSSLFEKISILIPVGAKLDSITITEDVPAKSSSPTQSGGGVNGAQTDSDAGVAVQTDSATRFKVEIKGNAKTREILLDFEQKLKGEPMFSDVECDDSNYVQIQDIDFGYVLYVSKDSLIKQ